MEKTSNHKKYLSKNPLKQYFIKNFQKTALSLLEINEKSVVCDLGCGEGFTLRLLQEKYPNIKLCGFDLNEHSLQVAQASGIKAEFKTLDVTNIPDDIKNTKYDYLLLMEVLEHIKDYEKVLLELSEMNFKKLLISVPNEPLFSYGNLIFGKNVKRLGKDVEHVNFWNSKTFPKLLENYFKVETLKTPFPWLMCICSKKSI